MSLFSEFPGLKRVPDFIGLEFDAARNLQLASGFGVRDPDPDAPPIAALWWNHQELVVTSQTPSAGSLLPRDERVSITLEEPHAGATVSKSAATPPQLHGHAQAD